MLNDNVERNMAFQRATLTKVCTLRNENKDMKFAFYHYKEDKRKLCNIDVESDDYGYELDRRTMMNTGVKCDNERVLYKTKDLYDRHPQIIQHIMDFSSHQAKSASYDFL